MTELVHEKTLDIHVPCVCEAKTMLCRVGNDNDNTISLGTRSTIQGTEGRTLQEWETDDRAIDRDHP